MGFRKALYDVEEKGLDPAKPHSDLADDGRLRSDELAESVAEAEIKKAKSSKDVVKKAAPKKTKVEKVEDVKDEETSVKKEEKPAKSSAKKTKKKTASKKREKVNKDT